MEIKSRLIKILLVFLTSLLIWGLTSCEFGEIRSAEKVLYEMIRAEKDLPAGKIYSMKSTKGAPDYISESLLSALYGNGNEELPQALERAEDMALRLSSGISCFELAVFLCPTVRDAREIADLCLARIDSMKHFFNANSEKLGIHESCAENIKNAKVTVVGRYAIMAVSPNAEECIKSAKNAIS